MQVENLEKNKAKITFDVGPEKFEEGMKHSYNKNKGKLNIPGFRKGKVPRKMLEMQFGKEVFFDDAINFVLDDAYGQALEQSGLEVVSRPEIDVVEVTTEKGVVFEAQVYTKPEVIITDYKGVTHVKSEISVSDAEIQGEMDTAREKNSRLISISDRAAQMGDIVTIDFKGYIDEEPFKGGEGKDYELVLGSKSFIDTFEEQIVGANIGDDIVANVKFPEEYHEEKLKNMPAKFEVEIKDIKVKELPEINDEFAQDVSEFDTLSEYKENIRSKIEQSKISEANTKKENDIVANLIEKAQMDVPQVMIDNKANHMVKDFTNRIQTQGIPVDMYLSYMGQTIESLTENYKVSAEKYVKGRLVLEKIAELESIFISEEEKDKELEAMAATYKMDLEQLKKALSYIDIKSMEKDIQVRKALEFVTENSIGVDRDATVEIDDPLSF